MDSLTHSRDTAASEPRSLARLVAHFVASKRSLSSAAQVSRANEIVNNAKGILETIASLHARNAFLKGKMSDQINALGAMQCGLDFIEARVSAEFKNVLGDLDHADVRIKTTIDDLKTTRVEQSLRPQDESPKALYDFIDASNVDNLTQAFRESIDHANDAKGHYAQAYQALAKDIQHLDDLLCSSSSNAPEVIIPPTAAAFHALESNATEMALLLSSLVKHYDLCISALKHTEGGGEAAEKAQVDLPDDIAIDSLDRNAPLQPLSDEERLEMMLVLDKDATEVDDVVFEIRERAAEMETQLHRMSYHADVLEHENASALEAASAMRDLGAKLPFYADASAAYISRWTDVKQRIEENLEELDGVLEVYANFLRSYDGLLVELQRRSHLQSEIEKVAQSAMKKIGKLHAEDEQKRNVFMAECGEFLPLDICPGMNKPQARWRINIDDEDVADSPG